MVTKTAKTNKDSAKRGGRSTTPAVGSGKRKKVVVRMRPLSESEANMGPAQRTVQREIRTIDQEPGRPGNVTRGKPSDREE